MDSDLDGWKRYEEEEELEANLSEEDVLRELEDMVGAEEFAEIWNDRVL